MENEKNNNVETAQPETTKKTGWFKKTAKYVLFGLAAAGAGYVIGTDKWGVRSKTIGACKTAGTKVKNLVAKKSEAPQVQETKVQSNNQGQNRQMNNNGNRPQFNKNN